MGDKEIGTVSSRNNQPREGKSRLSWEKLVKNHLVSQQTKWMLLEVNLLLKVWNN